MPLRPATSSLVALSSGLLESRKPAASPRSEVSSEMLTDSVALPASASKSGRLSIAGGPASAADAASAASGTSSHRLDTRMLRGSAALVGIDGAVGEIELLVRDPQRLDQLAARLAPLFETTRLPLVDEENREHHGSREPEGEPARDRPRARRRAHGRRRG